jgi:hypothetical protein
VKVSPVESVQAVGGTRRICPSGNDASDDENAERALGAQLELSAIEVIEDEPPCSTRRGISAEPDARVVRTPAGRAPAPASGRLCAVGPRQS